MCMSLHYTASTLHHWLLKGCIYRKDTAARHLVLLTSNIGTIARGTKGWIPSGAPSIIVSSHDTERKKKSATKMCFYEALPWRKDIWEVLQRRRLSQLFYRTTQNRGCSPSLFFTWCVVWVSPSCLSLTACSLKHAHSNLLPALTLCLSHPFFVFTSFALSVFGQHLFIQLIFSRSMNSLSLFHSISTPFC